MYFARDRFKVPLHEGTGIDIRDNYLADTRGRGLDVAKMNALHFDFDDNCDALLAGLYPHVEFTSTDIEKRFLFKQSPFKNLTLRKLDIMSPPNDLGEFDFVYTVECLDHIAFSLFPSSCIKRRKLSGQL